MADLSKLILPVKDATTGEISNQEFDLTGGGGGTGDMQKSVYDSLDSVAAAGGIPSYVSDQISNGVTIGDTGTASSTVVSYQRVGINGSYTAIEGTMYMLISNTSSTSYVFTNSNITSNSSIDVYTDTYGDNPSSVSVSGNTCTVTFSEAKTRSVKIYIK